MRRQFINIAPMLHQQFINYLDATPSLSHFDFSEDDIETLFDFYLYTENYSFASKLLNTARTFQADELEILDGMQLELFLASDQISEAYKFLQTHNHTIPYFIVQKVKVYLALGKEQEAISLAHLELQLNIEDPESYDVADNLARTFLESNCYQEALRYLAYCQKMQPNNIDLMVRRIEIMATAEKYQEALALIDKLLDRDAYFWPAWQLKAQILRTCGNAHEAFDAIEYAIAIAPKNWTLYLEAAQLADELQLDDKFMEYIKIPQKQCPNMELINELIGDFYYARANNRLALLYYHRVIRQTPNHLSYHLKLAMADIYHQKHKMQEAKGWVLEACKDKKADAFAEELAVSILMDAKDYRLAIIHAKKAIKYDKNNGRLYGLLGCILLDNGETESAISALRKACKLQPDNAMNFTMLAIGYFHSIKQQQVAKYLQYAYDMDASMLNQFAKLAFQKEDNEIIEEIIHMYNIKKH